MSKRAYSYADAVGAVTWTRRWGGVLGLGAALGALVACQADVAAPVHVSTTELESRLVPTRVRGASEAKKIAMFREIVNAHERARLEAQTVVPKSESTLSPLSPNSVDKGAGKRTALAAALAARSLGEIAVAHGMTVQDVEEIFREGETKRWPRH